MTATPDTSNKLTTFENATRAFSKAMDDIRRSTDDLKARLERVAPGAGRLIDEAVAKSLEKLLADADDQVKTSVSSDMDHGKEGDPEAIWNARLGSLGSPDLNRVDEMEHSLRVICDEAGFSLERRLRGQVGWAIGRYIFVPVTEALDYKSIFHFEEAVRAAIGRHE